MPGADAAQGFLGDAKVGSDHSKGDPVDKRGIGRDQFLIPLMGSGEVQVIESLLQLYDTQAKKEASEAIDIGVLIIQFFEIGVRDRPKDGVFQQLYPPPVGLVSEEAVMETAIESSALIQSVTSLPSFRYQVLVSPFSMK